MLFRDICGWTAVITALLVAATLHMFPSVQGMLARLGLASNAPGRSGSSAALSRMRRSSSKNEKNDASAAGGSDDADEAPAPQYEPSAIDVVVAKMMLQLGLNLPPEVVLSILDHAEYWPHTTATTDQPFVVHAGRGRENRFVLRTKPLGLLKKTHYDDAYFKGTQAPALPLADDAEYPLEQFQSWIGGPTDIIQRPCRKIVFTITSHDQGWASGRRSERAYEGSYTWFEAGLERFDKTAERPKDNNDEKEAAAAVKDSPAPSGETAEPSNTAEDSTSNEMGESSTGLESEAELPNPYLPVYALRSIYPTLADNQNTFHHDLLPSPIHTIQLNRTAKGDTVTHKVVWSWTDNVAPSTAEALKDLGRGEETGRGDFVRDLKPGDVVSVWAKARFGGWANYVDNVTVDVYWAL